MYITAIKIDNERAALTITEPSQEAERYLLGDADGDGEVTIVDATMIQRVLVNIPGAVINEAAADVDGDGEVTIIDATFIQRYEAGMIDLSDEAVYLADVDKDGEATVLDATWIQRWAAEMDAPEGIGV